MLTKYKFSAPGSHPPQKHLFQPLKLRCSHLSPVCRAEMGSHSFGPQCLVWCCSFSTSVLGWDRVLPESHAQNDPPLNVPTYQSACQGSTQGSGSGHGKRQSLLTTFSNPILFMSCPADSSSFTLEPLLYHTLFCPEPQRQSQGRPLPVRSPHWGSSNNVRWSWADSAPLPNSITRRNPPGSFVMILLL